MKRIRSLLKYVVVFTITIVVLISLVIAFNYKCSIRNDILLTESVNDNHHLYSDSKYIRPLINTYLTYPEWYIVYSSEEYASTLLSQKPSKFRYLGAINQFWFSYCEIKKSTYTNLNPNPDYDVMLWVIGFSYSLENIVKGIYENTIGRITETLATKATPEDLYIAESNIRYVEHIYQVPFYEFNYFTELKNLWTQVPLIGNNTIRKLERRVFFHNELLFKGIYAGIIKFQIYASDNKDETQIQAIIRNYNGDLNIEAITHVQQINEELDLIYLPRYQDLTNVITDIVNYGIIFEEISGNQSIFLTLIKTGSNNNVIDYLKLIELDFLMDKDRKRIGVSVPVDQLHILLQDIYSNPSLELEHLYDY